MQIINVTCNQVHVIEKKRVKVARRKVQLMNMPLLTRIRNSI